MSTHDILRKKKAILDDRRKLFDEIVQRINGRIERTPVHITYIDYAVPEVIFGRPTFSMPECIAFVTQHFVDEGLHVINLGRNTLRLEWGHLLSSAPAPRPQPRQRFFAPARPMPPSLDRIQRRLTKDTA